MLQYHVITLLSIFSHSRTSRLARGSPALRYTARTPEHPDRVHAHQRTLTRSFLLKLFTNYMPSAVLNSQSMAKPNAAMPTQPAPIAWGEPAENRVSALLWPYMVIIAKSTWSILKRETYSVPPTWHLSNNHLWCRSTCHSSLDTASDITC